MKIKNKSGAAANSMFLAFVKIITTLLSLITIRVLCSILSEAEYGTYAQVLLIVSTISSITILGMTDAINYFYNKHNGNKKANEYVSTIFLMQLVVSIIGIASVLSGRDLIIHFFDNDSLENLLIFAALFPLMQNLISMMQVLFISIGKAKQIAYRNMIISILNLCCFSIGCYLTRNIYILFLVTSALNILQILYFIVSLIQNGVKVRFECVRFDIIKEILTYCIPMEMFILTNSLSRDIDKYIVSAFESTEKVAIYANAAKVLPFDIIMTSFLTVMVPILTRMLGEKDFKGSRKLYSDFLMFSCISTTILAAGVIPLAEEMVEMLYSAKYLAAVPIFRVYILIDIIRVMSLSLVLAASGKTSLLMKISLGALSANLLLNIGFYKIFGIIGPSIATFLIMFITGILITHFSAKIMQTTISMMLPLKELFINILKISCLCVATFLLKRYVGIFIENYFIILVICYGCYLVLAFFLFWKKIIYYYKQLNKSK